MNTLKLSYFEELVQDVEKQAKRQPTMTKFEVVEAFFSEKHDVAIRFERLYSQLISGGVSAWSKSGFMEEDFDILFEHIERGYAQNIPGFKILLSVFDDIREMGSAESFGLIIHDKVLCMECDGEGKGDGRYGKCSECNGVGLIHETTSLTGTTEEAYKSALNVVNHKFKGEHDFLISSYSAYLSRIDEEVDLEKAMENWTKKKKIKPFCKLIGEDGNVFNLLGIVGKTLKRNNLHDEAEEVAQKVYDCESYDEALRVFMDYVDVY